MMRSIFATAVPVAVTGCVQLVRTQVLLCPVVDNAVHETLAPTLVQARVVRFED